MYKIKEIYNTIQCEGYHAGRVAIFCRFTGCNLWSGREEDRADAQCSFCDTDFIGMDGELGGKYTAQSLAEQIAKLWEGGADHKLVVFTGGEPFLQLDSELINILHTIGFKIAVETNGTIKAPHNIDWITVSPKAGTKLIQLEADELKLVYPQNDNLPSDYCDYKADYFYLQPMDNLDIKENTNRTIEYCKTNPVWKLSIQLHKYLGID